MDYIGYIAINLFLKDGEGHKVACLVGAAVHTSCWR